MRLGSLRHAIKRQAGLALLLSSLVATAAVAQPADPVKVNILVAVQSTCCANFLDGLAGKALGTFQEQGLDVTWQPAGSIPAAVALSSALAGDSDISLIGAAGALAAAGAGRPAKIFAARPIGNFSGIAVRPAVAEALANKGITPQSPLADRLRALKGLTLFSGSAGGPIWGQWRVALSAVGLDPDRDVSFQYGTIDVGVAAFRSNQVDVFQLCCEAAQLKAIGNHVIWATPEEMRVHWAKGYWNVWATSEKFASAHPETLRRVILALKRNAELYQSDRTRVVSGLAKLFPNIDPAVLADSFDYNKPVFLSEPRPKRSIVQDAIDFYNAGVPQKITIKPDDIVPAEFLDP